MKIPEAVGEPRVVWQGKYPNKIVSEQDYRFPDNRIETFSMWGKPTQKARIVLPITIDGNVVVTEQWRPGSNGTVYELAGGHDGVRKELEEELGYRIGTIIELPEIWIDAPSNQAISVGYLALGCAKIGEPKPEKSEIIRKREMSLADWFKLSFGNDRKKDAKTLATMWLLIPHLVQAGLINFSVP